MLLVASMCTAIAEDGRPIAIKLAWLTQDEKVIAECRPQQIIVLPRQLVSISPVSISPVSSPLSEVIQIWADYLPDGRGIKISLSISADQAVGGAKQLLRAVCEINYLMMS